MDYCDPWPHTDKIRVIVEGAHGGLRIIYGYFTHINCHALLMDNLWIIYVYFTGKAVDFFLFVEYFDIRRAKQMLYGKDRIQTCTYLSEQEVREVKGAASRAGISVSGWMRMVVLRYARGQSIHGDVTKSKVDEESVLEAGSIASVACAPVAARREIRTRSDAELLVSGASEVIWVRDGLDLVPVKVVCSRDGVDGVCVSPVVAIGWTRGVYSEDFEESSDSLTDAELVDVLWGDREAWNATGEVVR